MYVTERKAGEKKLLILFGIVIWHMSHQLLVMVPCWELGTLFDSLQLGDPDQVNECSQTD